MADDQAANSLNHYLDGSYEGQPQTAETPSAAQHHSEVYAQPSQQETSGYYYQTQGELEAQQQQQSQPTEQTYYSVEQQQQYHQQQEALAQASQAQALRTQAPHEQVKEYVQPVAAELYQGGVEQTHANEQSYTGEPYYQQEYVQPQTYALPQQDYQVEAASTQQAYEAPQQVHDQNQYADISASTYSGEAVPGSYETQTHGLEQGLVPQAAASHVPHGETSQIPSGSAIYADGPVNTGAGKGRLLFIGGAFLLAFGITGGGYLIGTNFDIQKMFKSGTTPTITASNNPAKISPKDSGGKIVANKEKKIFDRLGSYPSAQNDVAPTRTAQSEQPTDIGKDSNGKDSNDITTATIPAPKPAASAVGTPRMVKTSRIRADGTAIPQTKTSSQVRSPAMAGITFDAPTPREPLPRKLVKRDVAPIAAREKTKAAVRKPVKVAAIKEAPHRLGRIAQPQVAGQSRYVVQIASRRSESEALSSLAGFKARYGGNVDGYTPLIRKANLGSKGTWYRLQIGHMTSRAKAGTVCTNLKKKGLSGCFVTKQ